jgi:hypothetical protein
VLYLDECLTLSTRKNTQINQIQCSRIKNVLGTPCCHSHDSPLRREIFDPKRKIETHKLARLNCLFFLQILQSLIKMSSLHYPSAKLLWDCIVLRFLIMFFCLPFYIYKLWFINDYIEFLLIFFHSFNYVKFSVPFFVGVLYWHSVGVFGAFSPRFYSQPTVRLHFAIFSVCFCLGRLVFDYWFSSFFSIV